MNNDKKPEQSKFDEIKFLLTYFSFLDILKFIAYIPINAFKHIFYFLSLLVPRRKDIWVFGSWEGERFSDNSKYMFLYASDNQKKLITPVWLSKNKDIIKKLREQHYIAYYTYGLMGIYYNLRAKYIISDAHFNSVNFWCCGGGIKIQLFHGILIKNMGKNDKKLPWKKPLGKIIYRYFNPWLFLKNDYVISTSKFLIDKFATDFDIKKEKIIVAGYPRNDVIFKHIKGENLTDISTYDKMNKLISSNSNSKIILYMPTFRDKDVFLKKTTDFSEIFNIAELDKFLIALNGYFIIKPHPDMKVNIENQGRIIVLPGNLDIYPFLSRVDILITDYSSIYFDFLLAHKPIIFYPYDLETYIKESRGLSVNYEEFTPGPKALTFKELLQWMDYFVNGNDEFIAKRQKIMNLSFDNIDGNSSKRIFDYIYNLDKVKKT